MFPKPILSKKMLTHKKTILFFVNIIFAFSNYRSCLHANIVSTKGRVKQDLFLVQMACWPLQ